jgi:hypothetical protein
VLPSMLEDFANVMQLMGEQGLTTDSKQPNGQRCSYSIPTINRTFSIEVLEYIQTPRFDRQTGLRLAREKKRFLAEF